MAASLDPTALWRRRLQIGGVHTAFVAAAILLQGCAQLNSSQHEIGNWRGRSNYEINFQFVPPGMRPDGAELNSCMAADVPHAARCNGHGSCRQWRTSPTSRTEDFFDNGLFFCQCEPEWADPECRTRRKSQRFAYMLSMFLGLFGADQWYLGFWRSALLKLLTLGGCGIWYIFDIVRLGSAPVYAWDTYRLANDLPHWQFLITLIAFLFFIAFTAGVASILWHRLMKSREILLLQAEAKYLEQERLQEQVAYADVQSKYMTQQPATPMPQGSRSGASAYSDTSYRGYGSTLRY